MEVKKGYKQTEIGVIPDDWDVLNLGKSSVLKARIGWQGLTTAEYLKSGDYYLITGTDFKEGYIDWDNCVYVEKERYIQDKNIQVKEDDILVTKDGTIGKVAFIDKVPKETTLNSGVFVVRPINKVYNQRYLYYVLMSEHFKDFLNRLTAGSTISHLYQKDFIFFDFPKPSFKEQTAIANALSDTDAWINSLEQLLTKKRQIKQGAMQELLQPKEGWEVKKLGELITYKNGKSFENQIVENGEYFLITLNSIDIKGKLKTEHLKVNSFDNSLEKGDLIMVLSDVAHGNFLGLTDIIPKNNKYVLNQRMGALKNLKGVTSEYLSYYINKNQKYFKMAGKGSSQQNLGKDDILNFEINLPKTKQEQIRIATILSDMDDEIAQLETKLAKAKQIKQGMMQELLTGRTRLV